MITEHLVAIAREAGDLIMRHYQHEIEVTLKEDSSPVTLADQEANDLIVEHLQTLTPSIPIIAEESVIPHHDPSSLSEFWLVDPLDGTREVLKRNGDFTVNIALIRRGVPVLGIVHAPFYGTVYLASDHGEAIFEDSSKKRSLIHARPTELEHPTVLVSRSHRSPETDEFLSRFSSFAEINQGSSLKFCALAAGEADLYPRLGRTMEWDTAAGHAVLLAAGGRVETFEGEPLLYGKPDFTNPHFVAWGRSTDPLDI